MTRVVGLCRNAKVGSGKRRNLYLRPCSTRKANYVQQSNQEPTGDSLANRKLKRAPGSIMSFCQFPRPAACKVFLLAATDKCVKLWQLDAPKAISYCTKSCFDVSRVLMIGLVAQYDGMEQTMQIAAAEASPQVSQLTSKYRPPDT